MNCIRLASLCFVSALVCAPLPTHAQGGPPAESPGAGASLAAQMAALEARVLKLESGRVDAADLVGSYAVHQLGIEMNGSSFPATGVPARISTEAGVATFTLNANGTISLSGTEGRCTITQVVWTVACNETSGSGNPVPGLAWTVNNGSLIITEEGDETARVTIGAGGRVLIAGGTSTGTPNHSWSNIFIMVRLPNP